MSAAVVVLLVVWVFGGVDRLRGRCARAARAPTSLALPPPLPPPEVYECGQQTLITPSMAVCWCCLLAHQFGVTTFRSSVLCCLVNSASWLLPPSC